jgi:periplasmic protein CpxP/Spy
MPPSRFRTLRLAAVAAVVAVTSTAWAAPSMGMSDMQQMHMAHRSGDGERQMSPERQERMAKKMAEKMAERQAKLKTALQITPAQEPAWTAFVGSMAMPKAMARPSKTDMEKMTTPQRLDHMQAMKTQRDAHMTQRMQATKTFYNALTPEQQKRFDAESHRFMGHGKGHGKGGDKGEKGRHHG